MAAILLLLVIANQSDIALRGEGVRLFAVVLEERVVGRAQVYILQYEYGGEIYRGSISCSGCYEEGEAIPVHVDRDDPSRFVNVDGIGSRNRWEGLGWGLIFVLAFACADSIARIVRARK